MFRVSLYQEIWVPAAEAEAIERAARERGLAAPGASSGSTLADALGALILAPHISTHARFPLDECTVLEETHDEWVTTSSGPERRPRSPDPEERVVWLQYVIRVPDHEEARVRTDATSHYAMPIPLDSAVDDLVREEFLPGWWEGLEFLIRDYGFRMEN